LRAGGRPVDRVQASGARDSTKRALSLRVKLRRRGRVTVKVAFKPAGGGAV
jgi:hypothetical protein